LACDLEKQAIRRLADICVIVIAALLIGEAVVDRVIPAVIFYATKSRYEVEVAECERAKVARRLIASRLTGDGETGTALGKAANVQLLSCFHQETVKSGLLSWGVHESALRSLELNVVSKMTNVLADSDRGEGSTP
jgi:hypothetical protein